MYLKSFARVLTGFAVQLLSIHTSIKVFVSFQTSYLWTQTGIAIFLMLVSSDEIRIEKYLHLACGVASYYLLDLGYERFPTSLVLSTAMSNALGQLFGYLSLKYMYPRITIENAGTTRFVWILLLLPVTLASLVASVPGSVGFNRIAGFEYERVITNYTVGHLSGTMGVLYPAIILPLFWENRQKITRRQYIGLVIIVVTCSLDDYGLFAEGAVIFLFGLLVSMCMHADQWGACFMETIFTTAVIGFTVVGRGPFYSAQREEGFREILISTQIAVTASAVSSAIVGIVSNRLRRLDISSRNDRIRMEEMLDSQTLELFRLGHDLKNNICFVQGLSESMAENTRDGYMRDGLKSIRSIEMLSGILVQDIINSFKGKKSDATKTVIDLSEVMGVHARFAETMIVAGKKNITVSVKMEQQEMSIVSDRDRIHQVLSNIVGNAVKYTEAGSISLRTCRDDSSIIITVSDTGIGIDKDDIPNIFDPLFRCERAIRVNTGTGVGLSNVKEACDTIGATIDCFSDGKDTGSTFTLKIPIERETTERTKFDLYVLVIDDSSVVLKLMERYLSSIGCRVLSKSSIRESMDHIEGSEMDVVVTDDHMGVESGVEFITKIRNGKIKGLSRETPCILCSGVDPGLDTSDGITAVVTKPFTVKDLSIALASITVETKDFA